MLENKFIKISIIIPVFNEAQTILPLLEKVKQSPVNNLIKEIIIVNDNSTDKTKNILDNIQDENIKILHHQKNQGKGAALHTGFKLATGDIILIQDADLEYNPNEYQKLIQPILDNQADIVYGSRFIGAQPHRVLYFWHYVGNKILTLLSNMFSNLNLTDMETCYKVFRRKVLNDIVLKEKRFGFEPEFTIKVARKKFRFYEVGISYAGRTYEEGKKISTKDGLRAIWCIVKYGILNY